MRFEVEKNLLDIEERANRNYHTGLITIALALTSIIIALLAWRAAEFWHPLLYLLFGVPFWLVVEAFKCKAKADTAIEKMRNLNI